MDELRRDLFSLIDKTPHLDWLLLTKRPENIRLMWPDRKKAVVAGGSPDARPNVWLVYSASDQETLDAGLPHLLACRELVPVLGLSLEPLVGPVDLGTAHTKACPHGGSGKHVCEAVDWVIVGGESRHRARPCRVEWIRSVVTQCRDAGVPCFVKQLGSNVVTRNDRVDDQFNSLDSGWPDPHVEHHIHGCLENYQGADCRIVLSDSKGGDPAEWPEDLRVRGTPHEAAAEAAGGES
jgi:protein gp37